MPQPHAVSRYLCKSAAEGLVNLHSLHRSRYGYMIATPSTSTSDQPTSPLLAASKPCEREAPTTRPHDLALVRSNDTNTALRHLVRSAPLYFTAGNCSAAENRARSSRRGLICLHSRQAIVVPPTRASPAIRLGLSQYQLCLSVIVEPCHRSLTSCRTLDRR